MTTKLLYEPVNMIAAEGGEAGGGLDGISSSTAEEFSFAQVYLHRLGRTTL